MRRLIWTLVLGALAPGLDTTIVNVALPAVGRALRAPVGTTQWVVTGYLLAMGMAMPVTGWLTRRYGSRRMWLSALSAFLAASALSAAAWDVGSLIAFRVAQGVGAGLMLPIVTTLLVRAAGPERLGRMMAVATLPVVVVPVFGPVAGGLIVGGAGWRWIFLVNLPICLAALVLARRVVPADSGARGQRFDTLGLALLSPGVAALMYGLAYRSPWWLTGGAALVAAFTVHALRRRESPLINLGVLRIRSYAAAAAVLFLSGLSLYGPLLLISLYYQDVRGQSAVMTGLLLAPQGLGSLIPRTVAGKLTDRLGPRPVVVAGLLLTAAGTLAFTTTSSEWLLALGLFVRGAGLAAAGIAVMAGAFRSVPAAEIPDASSTTRIVQQVGGSFGTAVLITIVTTWGYIPAFWCAIAFALAALAPALLLSGRT